MAKSSKQSLVVTVSGRAVGDVTRDLKAAGFEVDQVLDAIGVVTGSADTKNLGRLRKISGVADLSPNHDVNIGPPGAPIS